MIYSKNSNTFKMESQVKIKKGQIENYISEATKTEFLKYQLKGEGGGGGLVSCTIAEAQTLINTNSLAVGSVYKISGVHNDLYDDWTREVVAPVKPLIFINVTNHGTGYGGFQQFPNQDIPLIGGSGTGGFAYINFNYDSEGGISAINGGGHGNGETGFGLNYVAGDVLTIDGTQFGGGTGFQITVREEDISESLTLDSPKGQTIYLTALTTNTFSHDGFGEFFNPKYSGEDGRGIFTNKSTWLPIQEDITTRQIYELGISSVDGSSPAEMTMDTNGNILIIHNNYNGNFGIISKVDSNNIISEFCKIPDDNPMALRVASDGYVYVAGLNNVYKVSPDGQEVTVFGDTHSASGGYVTDIEFAFGASDNLQVVYVSKRISEKIIKIENNGTTSTSTIFSTTGNSPYGMVNHPDGNIYIANYGGGNISKINLSDGSSTIFATTDYSPRQIIRDSLNNLLVSTFSGFINKVICDGSASNGTVTQYGFVDGTPRQMYYDGNTKELYVSSSEANIVTLIKENGDTSVYAMNLGTYTYGLCQNQHSDLIVVDYGSKMVFRVGQNDFTTLPPKKFFLDEDVIAENGATATISGVLSDGEFKPIDGDWTTATTIVGKLSGAKAKLQIGGVSQYWFNPNNWGFSNLNVEVYESKTTSSGQQLVLLGSFMSGTSWSNPTAFTLQFVDFINNEIDESVGVNAEVNSVNPQEFRLINHTNEYKNIGFKATGRYMYADAQPLTSTVKLLSYAIGDRTIYGGFSWQNITGIVGDYAQGSNGNGAEYNYMELDENWVKVPYSKTDYNFVIDAIRYDLISDFITYRRDKYGNEVEFNFVDSLNFNSLSTISTFPWGITNETNTYNGVYNNKIINSFVEIINFRGNNFKENVFENSDFSENVFSLYSNIGNNYFSNSEIKYNIFGKSNYIQLNSFTKKCVFNFNIFLGNVNFQNNTFSFNSFRNNVLNTYTIFNNNIFDAETEFEDNVFDENVDYHNNHYHLGSHSFENTYGTGCVIQLNIYGANVSNSNNIYGIQVQNNGNIYEPNSTNEGNTYGDNSKNENNFYGQMSSNTYNKYGINVDNKNNKYYQDSNNSYNEYDESCVNSNNTYENQTRNNNNIYNGTLQNVGNKFGFNCSNIANTYNTTKNNTSNITYNTYGVQTSNSNNVYNGYINNGYNNFGDNCINDGNTYENNSMNTFNTYHNSVSNTNNNYDEGVFNMKNIYETGASNSNNTYGVSASNSNNNYGLNSNNFNNVFGESVEISENNYGSGIQHNYNNHAVNSESSKNNFAEDCVYNNNTHNQNTLITGNFFGKKGLINSNIFGDDVVFANNTLGNETVFTINNYNNSSSCKGNTYGKQCNIIQNVFGISSMDNDNVFGISCSYKSNQFATGSRNTNNIYGFGCVVWFNNYISVVENIGNVYGIQVENSNNTYNGSDSTPFRNNYNTYGNGSANNGNTFWNVGENCFNKYGDKMANINNIYWLNIKNNYNTYLGSSATTTFISVNQENTYLDNSTNSNNFYGFDVKNNNNDIGQLCNHIGNIYGEKTEMDNNTYGSGLIGDNTFGKSTMLKGNNFNGSEYKNNKFGDRCSIQSNTFTGNSIINSNKMGDECFFDSNNFLTSSVLLHNDLGMDSTFSNNECRSQILHNGSVNKISFLNNQIPENAVIESCVFENKMAIESKITLLTPLSSVIFDVTINKTLYGIGTPPKIRYYNSENVMVITDM